MNEPSEMFSGFMLGALGMALGVGILWGSGKIAAGWAIPGIIGFLVLAALLYWFSKT